ncbi:MAG: ATP-dependent DNA helicase [Clostridia bacterium]|nr:ATP-dependent DNA helicase [Clostridia bacterium]
MRYDDSVDIIFISSREMVSTARRKISTSLPIDADEPTSTHQKLHTGSGSESFPDLSYTFFLDEYTFTVGSFSEEIGEGEIQKTVTVDTCPKRPKKEVLAQARGEAFLAAYALAKKEGLGSVLINFTYKNPDYAEEFCTSETVDIKTLQKFFSRCADAIKEYARPEIERVTKRLPYMKKIKFPFEKTRDGQGDLVREVYKNIARGGTLFISAPTGTGKTVSTLFPAIRAMGEGKCDKVFYFTPKTTVGAAASEAISTLSGEGANIRTVILSAKEKLCERKVVCRENRTLCTNSRHNNLSEAVLYLYGLSEAIVTPEIICDAARKSGVCPYELSLSYAELCDVVILDFNYLFDPAVYIRRFFSEHREYAFLIDEAHNLPDRAREMFSASTSEKEMIIPALAPILGEHSQTKSASRIATARLAEIFMPYLKDNVTIDEGGESAAAAHLSEIPSELYSVFAELIPTVEEEIFRNRAAEDSEKDARLTLLREYYYKLKGFYDAMVRFDSSYELFVFLNGNEVSLRAFCIDPANEISRRLSLGGSTVFFSGTLRPIHNYKSVLGGDRTAKVMETESPFDSGQISVSIMDKISTRFSERERTLPAVCRAIAATVSARRGNYMIFSPSFAYSEALAKVFSRKYPKIKVLSQKRNMSDEEKAEFIEQFKKEEAGYLIGFSVLGGIYSESVDFSGESLIGAVIVGIGMPALTYEREAMTAYYQDRFEEGRQFAYIYPGINKVMQAAGRIIRTETDRGVIVLIDDRFDDPLYKKVIPKLWADMAYIADPKELRERLDGFWKKADEESEE